jgi:hypothetical protein
MRKFLMVAAVVAVAACGKKQADTSAEQAGAAAGATIDTMAHKADSTMGAMADSAHAKVGAAVDTGKTVVQKAADALSAPADSVNKKMEKNPATPPKN